MASKIEKELQAVTKIKPKAKEERGDYLVRMAASCDPEELQEDDWGKLSKAAQDWANTAIKANNAEKDVADFPDVNGEDAEEGEAEVTETTTKAKRSNGGDKKTPSLPAFAKEKGLKPAKEAKTDTKAKTTTAKTKSKPVKEAGAGGVGIKVQIKQLMMDDPNISIDDIMTKLKRTELSRLTASTVRSEFRNSLRVLNDAGKLKGIPAF